MALGNTSKGFYILLTLQKQPVEDVFQIGVPKNFTILTGKHLCWSLFFIKIQAFTSATLLKRDYNTGVFLRVLRNL